MIVYEDMNTYNIKNLLKNENGQKLLFYLLQDFQTQTNLTRIVYPSYKKRKIHPNIEWWFGYLRGFCEEKEIISKQGKRKNNFLPYKKRVKSYRLLISNFISNFTNLKFSERTLKILEVLFYPRSIREIVFNKESFSKNGNDLELTIKTWLSHYFILGYIEQQPFKSKDNKSIRHSVINFDKHFNKKKKSEEISKDIFLVTAMGQTISSTEYISRFLEENFLFDLLEHLKDRLLIKSVKLSIENVELFYESIINEVNLKRKLTEKISKNKIIKKKEFLDINKYMGIVIDDLSDLQPKKEWEKDLERIKKLQNRIKEIQEAFSCSRYITKKDFIPEAQQWAGEGNDKRLIIPKI